MSKIKHGTGQATTGAASVWTGEYRIISRDITRIVLLNIVYLAAVLALYFTNRQSHYLEQLFARVFHW